MARMNCPHCSQQLELPDNVAGKTIRCPKCQQTFVAAVESPAPEPPPTSVQATAPVPAPPAPVNTDEAMTEKAPAARPRERYEPESRGPRRDRPAPAKSSGATILIVILAGVAALGLCICGGFGVMFGLSTFGFMVARQEARQEANVAAEARRAPDVVLEKIDPLQMKKMKPEDKELAPKAEEEPAKPQHGESKRLQVPNNREVRALQFTADGKSLFAASNAETVHSWNLATWEMKTYTLAAKAGFGGQEVGAAAFTPNANKVFFGKHGGTLTWYDLTRDPAPQVKIQIGEANRQFAFNHIAVSPDGKRVCTSHGDSIAFVWDIATQGKLNTLEGFRNQAFSGAFNPKSDAVAAGAEDVQVLEPATGKITHLKGGGPLSFRALQFSRDGRFLTGVNDRTLYHWKMDDARPEPVKLTYDQPAQHVAYSPDGTTLAVAVHFTRIYFYDAATLKQRFMIDMQKNRDNWDSPHAIAYHPDNRQFAVARGGTIYVFDLSNFDKGK